MKSAIAFTTLILLAAAAWASDQNSNPDLKQGVTNTHGSHYPHVEGDSHKPEKGDSNSYGSVLLDDKPSVHVPHKKGDKSHTVDEGFPLSN